MAQRNRNASTNQDAIININCFRQLSRGVLRDACHVYFGYIALT
jgi:hypothetical protein